MVTMETSETFVAPIKDSLYLVQLIKRKTEHGKQRIHRGHSSSISCVSCSNLYEKHLTFSFLSLILKYRLQVDF